MKKAPNFFVVGAPKCGTTALSEYLRTHPNVYFSRPKEPVHFRFDFHGRTPSVYARRDDYLRLFQGVRDYHVAVGEGSTSYLYSREAIKRILSFEPEARLIVMVRNPLDLVPAWHAQKLLEAEEDEPSIEVAWDLQERRARGERIPSTCIFPELLQYRDIGTLSPHLRALFELAGRERVLVHFFDDLVRDAAGVYARTLSFLGLAADARRSFPPVNERRRVRAPWIARRLARPPSWWLRIVRRAKNRVGLEGVWILKRVYTRRVSRQEVSPEMRVRLRDAFREEIGRLGDLLDRDLRMWCD